MYLFFRAPRRKLTYIWRKARLVRTSLTCAEKGFSPDSLLKILSEPIALVRTLDDHRGIRDAYNERATGCGGETAFSPQCFPRLESLSFQLEVVYLGAYVRPEQSTRR